MERCQPFYQIRCKNELTLQHPVKYDTQMLGVSRHLAYDLINNGYISGVKIGNAFKIPKVNVINYVMEEGVKNAS